MRSLITLLVLLAALATPAAAAASPLGLRRLRVTEDAAFAVVGASHKPVRLTLDTDLQRAADRLLARSGAKEAAIVASDIRTGRILAWASRGPRDAVAIPVAPSASLFKIVTAAALLEGGKVTPATRACYSGGHRSITARDLKRRGANCTTVGEALGRSINLVFARLAKKHLDADDLRRVAGRLGFAGKIPIDVPVTPSSVDIPDDPLGLARAAAGFWSGRLSPLSALFAMQTIANDGERVRLSIIDPTGSVNRVVDGRSLSVSTARTLRRMLKVTTRRGTCAKAFRHADGSRALGGMPVAAKTGTLVGPPPGRPRTKASIRMFSWFAAFAPANHPEIAVAVLLNNSLTWHTKANLVGRDLLEAYFADRAPAH